MGYIALQFVCPFPYGLHENGDTIIPCQRTRSNTERMPLKPGQFPDLKEDEAQCIVPQICIASGKQLKNLIFGKGVQAIYERSTDERKKTRIISTCWL